MVAKRNIVYFLVKEEVVKVSVLARIKPTFAVFGAKSFHLSCRFEAVTPSAKDFLGSVDTFLRQIGVFFEMGELVQNSCVFLHSTAGHPRVCWTYRELHIHIREGLLSETLKALGGILAATTSKEKKQGSGH